MKTHKWSEIKHKSAGVPRRYYAKLLLHCVAHGDLFSAPFLIRRVITGSPNTKKP